MIYSEQQYRNGQARAFVLGILFSFTIIFLLLAVFVLSFAIFDVSADVLGNLFISNPQFASILHEIRRVVYHLASIKR